MVDRSTLRDPTKPSKPLRILTIDGGGLQAISTLVILNKLLEAIGGQSGVSHRKPRPCDVFDTIAGIGTGGWLAILLGRFRMDITTCLTEWYKISQYILPRSTREALRLRLLQHCYFDTDRLLEQVDLLTQAYETGDHLFEPNPEGARTRHVFVAALTSDASGYNLFRSYEIPKAAKLPEKLLEGPESPSSFTISRAFGATGASKYFTNSWKERMASSGETRFIDTRFPKPHNITELALEEMWGIYGSDVPMSVLVNIGPGLPNDLDVKRIARRFFSGSDTVSADQATSIKGAKSPAEGEKTSSKEISLPIPRPDSFDQDAEQPSVRVHEGTSEQDPLSNPVGEEDPKHSTARASSFDSIKATGIDAGLRRVANEMETDIRKKLNQIYPGNPPVYCRLAPSIAPQGTVQNDSSASGVSLNAALAYLSEPHVGAAIDEVSKRIQEASSASWSPLSISGVQSF